MIRIPSKRTLDKYGLDELAYKRLLEEQGRRCPICKKTPTSGLFRVDHYHHPRYKYLPAKIRRLYVRGLLCVHCNRFYLAKGITVEKAENIVTYLKSFESRRPK